MTNAGNKARRKGWSNTTIAVACAGFFAGMVGMAYASVPLYQLFCQVTGYGGTTQRVEQASERILDKTIAVRFDANTNGIGWDFRPKQRQVTLKIGETAQVAYEARNMLSSATTGTATFNVTPQAAGAYFNKVDCFCFTEQTLEAGQSVDMPVVFFVDPEIVDSPELKDISTITLSYTFFPVDDPAPVAQSSVKPVETTTIR
jgi:cytochrome c oxidase assembly protein subunit 11